MERHAAMPGRDDVDGVFDIGGGQAITGRRGAPDATEEGAIDQHIAKPAADDDAKRGPDEEIANLFRRDRGLAGKGRVPPQPGFTDHAHQIPPADPQSRDISERVPADRKGPEQVDKNRIEIGIGDQGLMHSGSHRAVSIPPGRFHPGSVQGKGACRERGKAPI